MHCREAQRSKVYSYGWCCLKAFCVGVQKARELWQQLVLHTLLHPAALLHEKLPLVLFCLGFVLSTEEKQSAVNHQGVHSHTHTLLILGMSIQVRGLALFMQSLAFSECCLKGLFSSPSWWSLKGKCRQQYTSGPFQRADRAEKHFRTVQQISLTPDDGQLHLTCYRRYSKLFLGWWNRRGLHVTRHRMAPRLLPPINVPMCFGWEMSKVTWGRQALAKR